MFVLSMAENTVNEKYAVFCYYLLNISHLSPPRAKSFPNFANAEPLTAPIKTQK